MEEAGSNLVAWITGLQTLVLAVAGWTAIRQIKANREVVARRATFDALMNLITETQFREATRTVNALRKKEILSSTLYSEANRADLPDEKLTEAKKNQLAVQYWLNRFAAIATAIRFGALDEAYFKEAYYSSYMVNADYLMGYINSVREDAKKSLKSGGPVTSATAYQEIVWLHNRWDKDRLVPFTGSEIDGSRWRCRLPIYKQ